MEYVKATQAMEGLHVTPEIENLIIELDDGKITEQEFAKKALELAAKKD